MDVALYALPDHMQLVALEESLLLKALRDGVDDASALRPCFTLFTRNEIVYAAMQVLKADSLQHFLEYADMLARSNIMDVLVNVPEPDDEPGPYASRAEILAYHYLQEGRCALWTAVRSVARDLPFDEDPRSFTHGHTLRLGLYNKGGLTGLSGATKQHRSTCRLLNFMIRTIKHDHCWTNLAVNLNNSTAVHRDLGNADNHSLLIGISHCDNGQLWVQCEQGTDYVDAEAGMLAGNVYPTSGCAVAFNSRASRHATMPWQGGDRLVILAYTARMHAMARPKYGELLEDLGFVPPALP